MNNQIYRMTIPVGSTFMGPRVCTFGWQQSRQGFSIWYASDAPFDTGYIVLGTGHAAGELSIEPVATCIMPDGFHAFHLCRIGEKS